MNYKSTILTTFALLIKVFLFSQVAIIEDVDGYVNVRSSASVESSMVYQLKKNELFYYDFESYENANEWILVDIKQNKLSIILNWEKNSDISGYVHRTRIKPLTTLDVLADTEFKYTLNTKKFDKANHFIKKKDGYVSTINGLFPWGIDGYEPLSQIESIEYVIQSEKYAISKMLYQDLFNANEIYLVFKSEDVYFVSSNNSDGAGSYDLVWAINSTGELLQRFVGTFY